ncbi:hypothetical protein DPMN_026777 [Dreissena polymorpha]|uniref:Uncharacterized protein n=1 Tax=Dreissena polymorpha TaxID=45954 RepID=A0A9D4REN3_DREPO|nr:hypothetical protein DPMN_026777 [Dreissena polymorpha]
MHVLIVQGTHTDKQLPSVSEQQGDVLPILWRFRTRNYFLIKFYKYRIADLTYDLGDDVVRVECIDQRVVAVS